MKKSKTKDIINSSRESAMLAVEIYNKPLVTNRLKTYVVLMIMAYTNLFHAFFHQNIGDKYYFKERNSNRYKKINGERKAWDLKKCIKEYSKLKKISPAVQANVEFFIQLRNIIEHRYVSKGELDAIMFSECQALLYNFENLIIELFGEEFALNESLSFSLQFSIIRDEKEKTIKKALSKDVLDLKDFVMKYRENLSDDIYGAMEYSVKLIQLPKVTENRSDKTVEFVNYNSLNDDEKRAYEHLVTFIKEKRVKVPVQNQGKYRPHDVVKEVNRICGSNHSNYLNECMYKVFKVRPSSNVSAENQCETNAIYCLFDEANKVYVYTQDWVDFIVKLIKEQKISIEKIAVFNISVDMVYRCQLEKVS